MKLQVKAIYEDRDFGLGLELLNGKQGLEREITSARVQKSGLAIAGFVASIKSGHVQVLGRTERQYWETLNEDERPKALRGLLHGTGIACIVVTSGCDFGEALCEAAAREKIAVFRTQFDSGLFIARVHSFLDSHLSPETTIHGVLIDVFGVGILLSGASGIGKSECALDLILRGHRLVADDAVSIKQHGRRLEGSGSEVIRHHMEVRGLGVINVRDIFGAASVRERKRVELVVALEEWGPGVVHDRTGLDRQTQEFLGISVEKVTLPIRPGRNVASIVEVAARNFLLKLSGNDTARRFQRATERRLMQSGLSRAVDGERV